MIQNGTNQTEELIWKRDFAHKHYRAVPGRSKSTSGSPAPDARKGLPRTWIPGVH
jgi:hypothetical protein